MKSRIVKIEEIETNDRYDLTVPETNNFFANGILIHNTSARTGRLPEEKKLTWFQKTWNRVFGEKFKSSRYVYVSGSRRVVLSTKATTDTGYYSGTQFRILIHNQIKDIGLSKGETLYYEIVGYTENSALIMGSHGIEDKKLKKQYGNKMSYKYGCSPATHKVLIYRITQTSPDGRVIEIPWCQLIARCKELGLEAVPTLKEQFVYDGNTDELLELCNKLSQGSSTLDTEHIKEGVVLRTEGTNGTNAYKYKGFWFAELEGIRKNCSDYVDPEEIA